MLMNFVFVL